MEIRVYVVKTTDGRLPTVYGKDSRLDHVADLTRQYINYPDVDFEWIGTAVVLGGPADHPRISKVEQNDTLSKLFDEMVFNPQGA